MELILNGAGSLAFGLGMVVGGFVGGVVASQLVSELSKSVFSYQRQKQLAAAREAEFNRLVAVALVALEEQRRGLAAIAASDQQKYAAYDQGFELLAYAILDNDDQGVTKGLNCILSAFNQQCKFATQAEFDAFFEDEEAVLTL